MRPKTQKNSRILFFLGVVFFVAFFSVNTPQPTSATAGINQELNYQARLLTSTGAVVPDGNYNIEFKIYQDGDGCVSGGTSPCSGTLLWTETHTGVSQVTVKNGYFSVQLGSVTAFGSSVDWNQNTLWLSINIGGTGGTPSWDGEMTPFRRLSSTPYAMNAGLLGGLNADQFLQIAPSAVQVDSGTLDSLYLNKTGASGNILRLQKSGTNVLSIGNTGAFTSQVATDSTSAFRIISAGGSTVFNVDTTDGRVGIGGSFTPNQTLDVVGNVQVRDATTPTKAYRMRTSGGALDFEAGGADLYVSTWSGGDFTGTQYNQITFKADGSSMDFARGFNVASGYKVGIGTVSPSETLDVSGIIQQTGRVTSNTSGTDNNKWTKIGSCTMTSQYQGCLATVSIMGGLDGNQADNTQTTLSIRTRQQDPLASAPIVNVQLNGVSEVVNKSDIVAVTTQNDATATVVEIWGRITSTYEEWRYTPTLNIEQKWSWYSTDGFSAALPTGTQTAASYGDMYTNALTATGGVQFLNSSSAVIFKSDATNESFVFGSDVTTGKHVGIDYSGNDAVLTIGSADGNAISIGQYNAGAAELATDADLHIIRSTNSTSAFELLNASATALLTMDSTNARFRINGTGTNSAGSRLHFGDWNNVYLGETGTTDTDALTVHAEQGYTFETTGGQVFWINANGAVTFSNNVNSTAAFDIHNAAGTSLFKVDSTNGNVTIHASATTYTQRLCHNQANGATANMTLGDCAATGQADLAEFYATDGNTEPGDIVAPTGGYGVARSTSVNQANIIGVVSTNPMADGIIGNNVTDASRQPIALAGRIPLKVSLENGPIHPGDMLTPSSTPGAAMKAAGNVPIIGIALESYTDTSPRVSSLVTAEESDRAKVHAADLPSYTSNPSNWPENTGKIMTFLRFGTSGGQLSQQGVQQAAFNGGVVATDTTFNGFVSFNSGVQFNGSLSVNDDTAGHATIATGQTSTNVPFSKAHPDTPVITATPSSFISGTYRITDVTKDHFVIELSAPQSQDTQFSWLAIDKK